MDKKDLLFEIKPKYKVSYILMTHFVDLIILIAILSYLASRPNMQVISIIITIVIAFAIFCFVALRRKHYNRLYYYRFYPDRIVYRDTFFNKNVKELKYKNIKEIRYYDNGFLQTIFKLGEISFTTNNKNIFKKVVIFKLIPDVEKNYKKIAKVLDKKDDLNG